VHDRIDRLGVRTPSIRDLSNNSLASRALAAAPNCYQDQAMRTGRYSFPYVTYDPPSDVLYARLNQQTTAERRSTEEGDVWTYDSEGRPTGLIVVEPRDRFDRDGAVFVTLPSGERERLQGVESAMRAG